MSLGADVAAVLPALREQAESMHTDTFTVLRADGGKTTDPETLVEVDTYAVIHQKVMGKLQTTQPQPHDAQIPGATVVDTALQWHTSVNTLGVLTGDVVLCTAVGLLGDPDQVGVRVRIAGPFLKSLATARRFPVKVVS